MKLGIRVESVVKKFGDLTALNTVSFDITKPGLYGLIGPNGAGKTTLFKCIAGLLVPTSGDVFINDSKVESNDLSIKQKIGFLPEDSGLYDKLTAKEFLSIMAGMHGLSKKEARKKVKEIVELVGINFPPSKIVKFMSSGQRRLLLIASILLHNPNIIILDESLSGLDPINREHISRIMRELSKENIVLFSSHILSDIWSLCERILILKEGNLILDDTPGEILSRVSDNAFFLQVLTDIEAAQNVLVSFPQVKNAKIHGDKLIFHLSDYEFINEIIKKITEKVKIKSFGPNIPDLDQLFVRLVNGI